MPSNGHVTHETVEGTVEQRNDRGIRVNGEWLNRSQFHPVELPDAGARVRLKVDAKGYIRDLDVLSDQDQPVEIVLPDATATRLAVLQAAASFAAARTDVKSADVLTIAERWLAWVNQ